MSNKRKPNIVPTRPIFQPGKNDCGAACAAMVLEDLHVKCSLSSLYRENHQFRTIDRKTKWSSSPDGLQNTLNKNKPPGHQGKFEVYAKAGQSSIARRMVWAIFKYRLPCIANVYGGDHWVVVYGYEPADANPTGPFDGSYKITGLYVRDPVQSDNQRNIDYETWKLSYAKPIETGIWTGQCIAVCDPGITKKNRKGFSAAVQNATLLMPALKTTTDKNDSSSAKPDIPIVQPNIRPNPLAMTFSDNPVNGKKIVDKITAGNYALWWLKNRGFYNPNMVNLIMVNPVPGEPVLVEYLGTRDFYYLVPLKENNQNMYAIMRLAAENAAYQETTMAMDSGKPILFEQFSQKKIVSLLQAAYGKSAVGKTMVVHQAMVWKPCSQSLTPYLPFHMVTMGARKVYVRIDGKVFSRLTRGVLGS